MKKNTATITLIAVAILWALLIVSISGNEFEAGTAKEFEEGGLLYISESMNSDAVGVIGYTSVAQHLVIPETVEHDGSTYIVKSIEKKAFKDCTSIRTLTISDSVEIVNYAAFSKCCSLEKVVFGENLTTISVQSFEECIKLTDIEMKSVRKISNHAFVGCTSLETLVLPDSMRSIWTGSFAECPNIKTITAPITLNDGYFNKPSFEQCKSIEKVTLTKGSDGRDPCFESDWGSINYPWENSKKTLTTVIVSEGVRELGYGLFKECSSIKNLTLPSTLERIGDYAFQKCEGLEKLNLPDNVETIGKRSFAYCSGIKEMSIPGNLDLSTKNGEMYAFLDCCNIGKVTLTRGNGHVKNYSGNGSTSWHHSMNGLQTLIVAEGVTGIGNEIFEGCSKLTNVTFPSTLKSIGHRAFKDCKSLETLILPDGIITIGKRSFAYCSGLKEISVPGNLNTVVKNGSNSAFYKCRNIEKVTLTEGNGRVKNYSDNGSTPWHHSKDKFQTLIVAEGVTGIGNDTFEGCSKLTNVTFPSTLKSIGHWAFKECDGLETLILPDSVEKMDFSAFKNCSNLKTLTLPISLDSVVKNKKPAFEGCKKIEVITLTGGTGFGHEYDDNTYTPWRISESPHISLTISDDVMSIGTNTFRDCAFLKEITLDEGLISIHKSAFKGCKNLSVLNFPNSLKTIDAYSFSGCSNLKKISFGTGLDFLHERAFGDMKFHDSEGNVLPLTSGELKGCEFRGSSKQMIKA